MHIYQVKKRSCKSVLTFDRSCPHSATFRNTSTIFSKTLMFNILSKKPTWNYWDDNVKHENLSTAATDDKEERVTWLGN